MDAAASNGEKVSRYELILTKLEHVAEDVTTIKNAVLALQLETVHHAEKIEQLKCDAKRINDKVAELDTRLDDVNVKTNIWSGGNSIAAVGAAVAAFFQMFRS